MTKNTPMPTFPDSACPCCGQKTSLRRRHFTSWIWARWDCPNCGAHLRFNKKRRYRRAVLFCVWVAFCQALAIWLMIELKWKQGNPVKLPYDILIGFFLFVSSGHLLIMRDKIEVVPEKAS